MQYNEPTMEVLIIEREHNDVVTLSVTTGDGEQLNPWG